MRNDNDVDTKGRVADWLNRLTARSITPAWWRRTTNRWVAASVLGLIVLAPVADAVSGTSVPPATSAAVAGVPTDRAAADAASRGTERTAATPTGKTAKAAAPKAAAPKAAAPKAAAPKVAAPKAKAAPKAAAPKAKAAPKAPAKAAPKAVTKPKPVAGLTQAQMDNAAMIVRAGKKVGLPKRAHVIAVATAMQESQLLNLANPTVPRSLALKSQGIGYDHDSIGLFQQRPSSGWGTPAQLLNQDYAATQFYLGLRNVPGWSGLPLTVAAQAVQVSAYPDAYAKHEARATQVVNALTR